MNLPGCTGCGAGPGDPAGVAPRAVESFTVDAMRGRALRAQRHRGLERLYNSNPEAAQRMIDVLSQTRAERRFAVLGEMLELGHAAEALHRQVGAYAARHGVDVLIGVRGQARLMVEAAAAEGVARRSFSRTRFKPGNSSAGWRRRETRCCSKAREGAHGTARSKVFKRRRRRAPETPRDCP